MFDRVRRLIHWRSMEYYAPWPFNTKQPTPKTIPHTARSIATYIEVSKGHRLLSAESKVKVAEARKFLWWMEETPYPQTDPGLTVICRRDNCVSPLHMVLATDPRAYKAPPPKPVAPKPIVEAPKLQPKPAPKPKVVEAFTDRTRCMSAKIWYPSQRKARAVASKIRFHNEYPYKCDFPLCGGWHLTHIKTGEYVKRRVGIW